MAKRKIVPNEVKQKVRTFIKSERGQVSKHSLVTLGAFLGTAALGAIIAAKTIKAGTVTVTLDTDDSGKVVRVVGSYSS